MQMIPIFGTWVGVAPIHSLNIQSALEYVQVCDEEYAYGGDNGSVTVTQRLLDAEIFKDVKLECEILSHEYARQQGHQVEAVRITSSWGNTLKKNEPIHVHMHPNSYVSGVFYLTDGAPLNFHSPFQTEDLFTLRPLVQWEEHNECTWQVLKLPIKAGYAILFPSRLKHHVDMNTNDYRYSVAFNTMPTGSIGDSTKELNIVEVK